MLYSQKRLFGHFFWASFANSAKEEDFRPLASLFYCWNFFRRIWSDVFAGFSFIDNEVAIVFSINWFLLFLPKELLEQKKRENFGVLRNKNDFFGLWLFSYFEQFWNKFWNFEITNKSRSLTKDRRSLNRKHTVTEDTLKNYLFHHCFVHRYGLSVHQGFVA